MSLDQIIVLLTTYKYLILFPIVVVEGPIITVIAGFLTSLGFFNFSLAYAVIVVGDITGDSLYYALAYHGRYRLIDRWGHYIGLTVERVQKFEHYFEDHSARLIIFGKFAYALEVPFLIGAGLAKVPYRKFLLYTLLPSLPKSLLFLLIGYYFGRSYAKISTYLDYTALGTIALALVLVAVYFIVKKISKKYSNKNIPK